MLRRKILRTTVLLIIEKAEVRLFRMPPSVPWEDATHRVPAIEIIVLGDGSRSRGAWLQLHGWCWWDGRQRLLHDYCTASCLVRCTLRHRYLEQFVSSPVSHWHGRDHYIALGR